ncbi:MAG: hypothetical protein RR875_00155 [Clostridium sp.]
MANEQNLRPVRSASEARERGRNGGKKSGEVRRKKANFRKTLNLLLTTKIDSQEWTQVLEVMGLESTLEAALNMAMIKEGLQGNVKAYEAVAKYAGQSDKTEKDVEEQQIRTDRAKRARDMEVGDLDSSEESIQNFLNAVRPTTKEMESLFDESVESGVENQDEEAEKSSEI